MIGKAIIYRSMQGLDYPGQIYQQVPGHRDGVAVADIIATQVKDGVVTWHFFEDVPANTNLSPREHTWRLA